MKLAILTNTIAPYRIPLYGYLSERFDVAVFHGGPERNRQEWSGLTEVMGLRTKRSWGFQVRLRKKRDGLRIDSRFLHITPGFLIDLVRFRPRAVISNEMGLRSLIAMIYGLLFRIPVWIWWGGTCHTEASVGPTRRIVRKAFGFSVRHWISYGASSTEYLMTLGVPRDRILQVQNCVDDRLFSPLGNRYLDVEPRPVVLYVGQLIPRKGVSHLVRAAGALQREGHKFSLLIVGSGSDEAKLRALVQELGLSNVHFEAALAPDQMPAVYRSADLLVFPTLEDVWGLVVNEAILSGLPVLCSKYAGCASELVRSDSIFDPTDPESFAESLRGEISRSPRSPDSPRLASCREIASLIAAAIFHVESDDDSQRACSALQR